MLYYVLLDIQVENFYILVIGKRKKNKNYIINYIFMLITRCNMQMDNRNVIIANKYLPRVFCVGGRAFFLNFL